MRVECRKTGLARESPVPVRYQNALHRKPDHSSSKTIYYPLIIATQAENRTATIDPAALDIVDERSRRAPAA